jgi:uncharacterized protein YbjT (DUF2867 family)
MEAPMRVFVAGATGALGSQLVPQLAAAGHDDVIGMTRSPAKTDAAILGGRQLREAQRARSAVLDLLLAEIGITFDRWVVLNAIVTGSVPADVGLLVPALSAALDATDETVRFILDEAESGHLVRVVSAPSGDPAAAQVELTAEGEVLHERLRAVLDELTAELSAGIPRRDRETAGRVLAEITRQAGAGLDSDRGVRFGK